MWDNIPNHRAEKRLITRIHDKLPHNNQKDKQPNKNKQRPGQALPERTYTNGQ